MLQESKRLKIDEIETRFEDDFFKEMLSDKMTEIAQAMDQIHLSQSLVATSLDFNKVNEVWTIHCDLYGEPMN